METLDELKGKASFLPLEKAWASFRTHRLDFSRRGKIRVTPTVSAFLFCGIFAVIGTILTIIAIASLIRSHFALSGDLLTAVPGIVFIVFSVSMFRSFLAKHAVFDLFTSQFISKRHHVPFSRIKALQIVEHYQRNRRGSFHIHELNLVLDDASRIHVFAHGNKRKFDKDAEQLSKRLGCPIWTGKQSKERQDSPAEFSKKGKIGLCIYSFVFISFPLLFGYLIVGMSLIQVVKSGKWEKCPATIIQSQLEAGYSRKGGRLYKIDVCAKYIWENQTYVCKRYDFFMSDIKTNMNVAKMRAIVKAHPVGKQIELYVNPDSPWESVISRDVPILFVTLIGLFLSVFLCIGVFSLLVGLGVFRRKSEKRGK